MGSTLRGMSSGCWRALISAAMDQYLVMNLASFRLHSLLGAAGIDSNIKLPPRRKDVPKFASVAGPFPLPLPS